VRAERLRLGLAAGLALGLAASASAGDAEEPQPQAHVRGADRAVEPVGSASGPRALLARQLDDEAASVERAQAAVDGKLGAAQVARTRRLRAAVRAMQPGTGDDAMAVARRRAAARLLVDRDAGERALLVDELAALRAAHQRIAAEVSALPAVVLPGALARPAAGKIARRFGTLEHERSKATLARRGIDLEVAEHCAVTAPAAGTVRYAGPIRGLDQGVILDHGGYLTVIGKLGELALPVGAPIAAGDRIGRAARHRVYLEVRVKLGPGGLPIDPEPLLEPSR